MPPSHPSTGPEPARDTSSLPTVWVLGDQLNRQVGALARYRPGACRVLLVESASAIGSRRWHRQRLHLVLSAMAHFAAELRAEGYEVDHRQAPSFAAGLAAHRAAHLPGNPTGHQADGQADPAVGTVLVMEPSSWDARQAVERLDVELVPNTQFLCPTPQFAAWADGRRRLTMEDFYRFQRTRLGVLMDGDGPAGGRWNFDAENRQPPPRDGRTWPEITSFRLDPIDREVLARLPGPPGTWGADPMGLWPVTRHQALQRLDEFVTGALPRFGPHQDAMLSAEWKLAHSVLSSSMNLGLLHPGEVVEAAEVAYRNGDVPLASAEGFIRQVLGWREYVWGLYWLWMPEFRWWNGLDADRGIPPAFTGASSTGMACVASAVGHVHDNAYAHHIERLMVFGNLALTAGIDPASMTGWMRSTFIDGADWVMVPNVVGMALHADGGRMATKPYAAGGAYVKRMSDLCAGCRYRPDRRTGPDACPLTTLYWDFLDRHRQRLATNHRMARQLAGLDRLADLDEVRARAREVLVALDAGTL